MIISKIVYQFPLGLKLHFYSRKYYVPGKTWNSVSMPSRAKAPFLRIRKANSEYTAKPRYQCPLGLKLHFYSKKIGRSGEKEFQYQCPLGLKLHFYDDDLVLKQVFDWVSMPSRAKAPFLRYPFKNLGFMRFLEHVFAGIYQNILTMTIFRAC